MDVLQLLCVSRSKAPLAYVWHERNDFIPLTLCLKSVSDVASWWKALVSMLLSKNGFTILTCVTFIAL